MASAMTTEFQANQVVYGDAAGFGAWQVGHARQHLRYLGVLARKTPPVILPDVPLFSIGAGPDQIATWFRTHYFDVHVHLREQTHITGPDFSIVDLSNEKFFYDFIGEHNNEHALLDIAFGVA